MSIFLLALFPIIFTVFVLIGIIIDEGFRKELPPYKSPLDGLLDEDEKE